MSVQHSYAYTHHRNGTCGKSSRMCRYCHPEQELVDDDEKKGLFARAICPSIHERICLLLQNESRYRNKFDSTHFVQLEKAQTRTTNHTLEKMIRTRLEKRLRVLQDNDGFQTPYLKHGVDVACHCTATCCRECVQKWYGFDVSKKLNDMEMEELFETVYTFITKYLLSENTEFRTWMSEIEFQSRFYEPGFYVVHYNEFEKIPKIMMCGPPPLIPSTPVIRTRKLIKL